LAEIYLILLFYGFIFLLSGRKTILGRVNHAGTEKAPSRRLFLFDAEAASAGGGLL
jgi:hypothetical protein